MGGVGSPKPLSNSLQTLRLTRAKRRSVALSSPRVPNGVWGNLVRALGGRSAIRCLLSGGTSVRTTSVCGPPPPAACSTISVMATEIDPARRMPQAIFHAADLGNARILEVGAGDGRLTFQYASEARSVIGIDTNEPDIRSAGGGTPDGNPRASAVPLCQRDGFAVLCGTVRDCVASIVVVMSRTRGHGRCPAGSAAGSGTWWCSH